MDIEIDTKPPPPPTSLRALIASLEPGQSLKTRRHSLRVATVTASNCRRKDKSRTFKVGYDDEDKGAIRVWRLT